MVTPDLRLTYAMGGRTIIRYVPAKDGWHVYITDYDPFPVLWSKTLGEAVDKGRRMAADLGYEEIRDKVVDYK